MIEFNNSVVALQVKKENLESILLWLKNGYAGLIDGKWHIYFKQGKDEYTVYEGEWILNCNGELSAVTDNVLQGLLPKKDELKSLPEYFDEFAAVLRGHIEEQNDIWGDTWKERGLFYKGLPQEYRFNDWLTETFQNSVTNKKPFPWLKVAGEAMIGYIREKYMGDK